MEYINETLMEKEKKNLLERVRAFEGSMGGITKQYCHLLEAKKSLTAKRDEIVSDIDNSHKAAAESLASNHTELHHQLSKIYDIQLSEIEGHIQVVEDFNERVSKILNLSLDELVNFTELLKVKNEVLADMKGLSCTMRQIENTTISERNDLILRVNPLPVQIGYLVKKIVTFTGNIPSLNKQGIPHSLTLQAIGEDNNNIQHGGVAIEASISHTHDDHTPLPTQVIDNNNGTYTLNYTPKYHTPIRVVLPNYECKINVVRSYTPMVPIPTEYPVNAHPSGVCILPGNMIAVSLQEKIVKIYDVENQQTVTDIKSNFVRPYLMTLDKDNLWVTDREAHNIQRFSLDGFKKTLQYGSKGTTNWQFLHPRGIAVHPITGHIYVSDMRNHRISVFKVTDDTLVVVGNFGKVGDGPGQFDQPAGIMFNQYDQLVVCDDRNCRLQIFDGEGQHISTYGVSANSNKGILCSPIGVAQDNYGRYVVGEFGSHLVTVLSFEGDILSCIRSGGKGIGCLSHPRGVAIDNDGFMYVADFGNKRVVRM
jgi:DNA-binding beta-propeller fold protein YncE